MDPPSEKDGTANRKTIYVSSICVGTSLPVVMHAGDAGGQSSAVSTNAATGDEVGPLAATYKPATHSNEDEGPKFHFWKKLPQEIRSNIIELTLEPRLISIYHDIKMPVPTLSMVSRDIRDEYLRMYTILKREASELGPRLLIHVNYKVDYVNITQVFPEAEEYPSIHDYIWYAEIEFKQWMLPVEKLAIAFDEQDVFEWYLVEEDLAETPYGVEDNEKEMVWGTIERLCPNLKELLLINVGYPKETWENLIIWPDNDSTRRHCIVSSFDRAQVNGILVDVNLDFRYARHGEKDEGYWVH